MTRSLRRMGMVWILVALFGALTISMQASAAGRSQQIAASVLKDIHQATWIAEGKGPHVAYVFFDPNCPYCHKLYTETRSWIKAGKLELRWIPVGLLTETSHGKAGAMLDAKDPLTAFYTNEDKYDPSGGLGGVEEALDVSPKAQAALKANAALLARTGFGSVPALLFHADDGESVLIFGAPGQAKLDAILAHVK